MITPPVSCFASGRIVCPHMTPSSLSVTLEVKVSRDEEEQTNFKVLL